jgi:hypothetical protein
MRIRNTEIFISRASRNREELTGKLFASTTGI